MFDTQRFTDELVLDIHDVAISMTRPAPAKNPVGFNGRYMIDASVLIECSGKFVSEERRRPSPMAPDCSSCNLTKTHLASTSCAYAEAQAALGRLYDVVGIDPVPEAMAWLDIASLSAAIRRNASDWKSDRLEHLSEGAPGAAQAPDAAAAAAAPQSAQAPSPQRSAQASDSQPVVQ
jgi:hypothetical protein